MATFYTGVDKERYDAGNKYVPMDRFLLNYQTPTTDVKEVETSYGIPNTNAFLGGGGGENNIPLTYNKKYDPFPYRQASERSFVGATDRVFDPQPFAGGLGSAQEAYNYAQKGIDQGFGNMRSDDGRTVFEMQKEADNLIQDARMRYATEAQYDPESYYREMPSDLAYSTDTEAMKMMEMYPEYYNTNPKASLSEGIVNVLPIIGPFSRLMKNQIGPYLPVNKRSILENEILRDGVMVDDIGRIVQGKGAYDTAANVMAGYNPYRMTEETFDKRISRIQKTLEKKYGSADYKGDKTKLDERLAAIQEAKQNFLDAQGRTDLIAEDEEDQKEKQKQKTLISKLFTKKGAQDVTAPGDGSGGIPIVNITSGDNTSPGDGGGGNTGDPRGQHAGIDYSGANYGPHKDSWSGGSGNQGTTPGAGLHADYNQGGRVYLNYGGLASIL